MSRRQPPKPSHSPTTRGNRRTRSGAGRHNLSKRTLKGPAARVRVCLGCDRPFRSRGPWNRFCRRCAEREIEEENARTYAVPKEWPASLLRRPEEI